jgi:hypothetical protein
MKGESRVYWNHRILSKVEDKGTPYEAPFLYVVEVYYNSSDDSIIGWTEKEVVYGESLDEIRQTLHWMLDALDKPVIIEEELKRQMEELCAAGEDPHEHGIVDFSHIDLDTWEDEGGAPSENG